MRVISPQYYDGWCSQNRIYLWSPVEIKTPTHWNLIGSSMTAPPPVLSPNSILPPPSSHCAFSLAKKISVLFKKKLAFLFLDFFFKLRKPEIA
jgi:hypothetical protein